jgi:hypothetical protein
LTINASGGGFLLLGEVVSQPVKKTRMTKRERISGENAGVFICCEGEEMESLIMDSDLFRSQSD